MSSTHSETVVISLGGSLVVPDGIDIAFLVAFKKCIATHIKAGKRFAIIIGGGKIARHYQDGLRASYPEHTSDDLDWIGIHSTHLNAHLLQLLLQEYAATTIVTDPHVIPATDASVIVGGGWKPGWSTDYDAVVIAETLKAKTVINLSNVDHVYDKDPRAHEDAQAFDQLSWSAYRRLIPEEWQPGLSTPFDPVASEHAERLGLEVLIVSGGVTNLDNYLSGESFSGTVIS